MTVQNLIDKLAKYNPDDEVLLDIMFERPNEHSNSAFVGGAIGIVNRVGQYGDIASAHKVFISASIDKTDLNPNTLPEIKQVFN